MRPLDHHVVLIPDEDADDREYRVEPEVGAAIAERCRGKVYFSLGSLERLLTTMLIFLRYPPRLFCCRVNTGHPIEVQRPRGVLALRPMPRPSRRTLLPPLSHPVHPRRPPYLIPPRVGLVHRLGLNLKLRILLHILTHNLHNQDTCRTSPSMRALLRQHLFPLFRLLV